MEGARQVKLNLGSGSHPLDGFDNLDKQDGWTFESGLGAYEDGSIDGITISHALMYVPLELWTAVFGEFARVLKQGQALPAPEGASHREGMGVLRITEDATDDPRSSRYGGFDDAVTLTSAALVVNYAALAGLQAWQCSEEPGLDPSLVQRWHGSPPKVFHVEAIRL